MVDMIQTSRDDRTKLDKVVTAFSLFIHDLCPDAHLEISFVRYEDEDAHIWVTLPSTLAEEEREDVGQPHGGEKAWIFCSKKTC